MADGRYRRTALISPAAIAEIEATRHVRVATRTIGGDAALQRIRVEPCPRLRCNAAEKRAPSALDTFANEWVLKNPNYEKERYQKNKGKSRERHLVRKYGVDLPAYNRLNAAQNGKCAICEANEEDQPHKVFHVDHCHQTRAVRGLLCSPCNQMLGAVRDDPETLRAAIAYLERPQIPEMLGNMILAAERE